MRAESSYADYLRFESTAVQSITMALNKNTIGKSAQATIAHNNGQKWKLDLNL